MMMKRGGGWMGHNGRGDNFDARQSCAELAALFADWINKCQASTKISEIIAKIVEPNDGYTQAHSNRVQSYATIIANEMGLDEIALEVIRRAAALHDCGKAGIPTQILTKPNRLTEEEFALIQKHPHIAAKMLERLLDPEMLAGAGEAEAGRRPSPRCGVLTYDRKRECILFVYHHHEWFNGTGYPERRAGKDIPIGSRVIAVADAFDAMTADRPYRKAVSADEAERELLHYAGLQFDPDVVKAFCSAKRKGRLRTH